MGGVGGGRGVTQRAGISSPVRKLAGTRDGCRVSINYSTEMVLFDGVLKALQGLNLRAGANVETNMPVGYFFLLLNLSFKLTSCFLSGWK